jgi:rubrerythrin
MNDELTDLLEAAMLKEVASGAFYAEGQKNTDDPGARALLKELASMERGHLEIIRKLSRRNHPPAHWRRKETASLRLGDYLSGGESLDEAGLQDTLVFAIKQEQKAADFYSQMKAVFTDEEARRLCQYLIDEENEHRRKLELFYDDFIFAED